MQPSSSEFAGRGDWRVKEKPLVKQVVFNTLLLFTLTELRSGELVLSELRLPTLNAPAFAARRRAIGDCRDDRNLEVLAGAFEDMQ